MMIKKNPKRVCGITLAGLYRCKAEPDKIVRVVEVVIPIPVNEDYVKVNIRRNIILT